MKYLSSLKNQDLFGKVCLLRADFNLSSAEVCRLNAELRRKKVSVIRRPVSVSPRVATILPAIKFLLSKNAKVIVLSHRGRPHLKTYNLKFETYTLKPFTEILSNLLKKPINFLDFSANLKFTTSQVVRLKNRVGNAPNSSIFLLENLRFSPAEEKNDKKFAKQLAELGDFYVNEAFSVSHRKDASVEAITEFLPSYAGFSLESEIKNLSKALKSPKKPLVIVLGGIKIADKIGLIENFKNKADKFLIGGGIANTFFASQKMPMGNSIYEKDKIAFAKKMLKFSKIILPVDSAVKGGKILDIGPETAKQYAKIIKSAKTIIWNGPMGYIEDKNFRKGSEAVLKAIINSKAFSIIGGGETVAVFQTTRGITQTKRGITQKQIKFSVNQRQVGMNQRIFISTGGGAMLEFLAGKKLPGIEALKNNKL